MQESVRHDLGDICYVWENSLLPNVAVPTHINCPTTTRRMFNIVGERERPNLGFARDVGLHNVPSAHSFPFVKQSRVQEAIMGHLRSIESHALINNKAQRRIMLQHAAQST